MNLLIEMIEELSKELGTMIQEKITLMLDNWYKLLPEWLYKTLILSRA